MDPLHIFIKVDDSGVKQNLDSRHKRVYASVNSAAFVINQIERRYEVLESELLQYDEFKRRIGSEKPKPGSMSLDMGYQHGNSLVAQAWDLVDWIERLRKIMGKVSGVKKNAPWLRNLVKGLKPTEELRHFIQHFDRSLSVILDGSYPLMGSLIAFFSCKGQPYVRVLISTPARYAGDQHVHISGFLLPKELGDSVGEVTLSVANQHLNISQMVNMVREARSSFAKDVRESYDFEWPAG